MPEDFKTGSIVKLVKKEDLCDCISWRGITLLSLTIKEEGRGTFEKRIDFCKENSCSNLYAQADLGTGMERHITHKQKSVNDVYPNFID